MSSWSPPPIVDVGLDARPGSSVRRAHTVLARRCSNTKHVGASIKWNLNHKTDGHERAPLIASDYDVMKYPYSPHGLFVLLSTFRP
uniref:Uncharacterized protein n=1 Tax=Ralstonia syzygii R24 TaxID=907261 RepID=G3AA89_9RALS|nr:conserved hypothetical protein [Ralstonia syzygii R24]